MSKEVDESNIIPFRTKLSSEQGKEDTTEPTLVDEETLNDPSEDVRVQVMRELLANQVLPLPADIQIPLQQIEDTQAEDDIPASLSLARLRRESESVKKALDERRKPI